MDLSDLPPNLNPPTPRDHPYVWATWLRSLLSGEASCEWAAWFKAHNKHTKRPNGDDDGKLAQWQIEHATLLANVRDKFRADGYTVFQEQQNAFKLKAPIGTLAGKPDLIALKDKTAWVIDVKTKSIKVRDRAQVMLYMWALPMANIPRYRGVRFDGRIITPSGEMIIGADEVDAQFIARVKGLLRRVCGPTPLFTSPSGGECRYCDISSDDCHDRLEEPPESEEDDEMTDAF